MDAQMDTNIDPKMAPERDPNMDPRIVTKMVPEITPKVDPKRHCLEPHILLKTAVFLCKTRVSAHPAFHRNHP